MNMNRWCKRIATLGPVGYFIAPGTVATLLTLPVMYWMHHFFENQWLYLGLVVVLFVLGIALISKALKTSERHEDPSEIVFDEIVGCLLVFWGIALTTQSILIDFLLFRALDIIKLGWVKKAEDFVGAWGVMSDDIVAALLTNIVLRLLF